ncbi:alkyl hydroperoxide reductase subunit F [Ideonella sp. 4Y16]|uniref:Alkyl hydroperoxide reductase subunit F n=1 Tax=Ideonella alba TaxID=2824118 RepID=A0A941BFJ1_9BURK|nr:alkyl hydroperoxide reductase subunit F [Ideonella alba]MBQ0929478.1 alkyl hydroperoxide reductase subunit F [Ideonella alba]MBQ0944580.1 alkyl hydroperoxide reductase subunit F [Ideonella alba]
MLDDTTTGQLAAYFERISQPIELIASLDDSEGAQQIRELITEIAAIAPDKIRARFDGQFARRPSFQITRVGHDMGVHFAAVPMGHEFTSLVLALLWAGGHPPKVEPEVLEQIRAIDGDFAFDTFMSLTCHNCPDVVQAMNLMAVFNPRIRAVAIDGGLFQAEVEQRQIMAVPSVFLNDQPFGNGRMEVAEILAKIDTGAAKREAAKLSERAPYEVLIIGGGPAGAAAAVYAARKGIRTGIVAERFGGQTMDTLAIENFISVQETDGPKFAAALEAHVRQYGVDVMTLQRVARIDPAPQPGGYATVTLDNGATLKGRSLILATGARWRNMNVPGEAEYRTKGVAYCPHCDGPLFKGKDVAVIGGGNSGVEAAIDLAGVVRSVTLLEFADQLKADQVLVDKLRSLPNVTVHLNAQTTEVTGDGQKMTGLKWKDRVSGEEHAPALAGVFVQIGLVPNTEFLKGTIELSRFGEIVVDAKGHTSVPGIFAAGDATTVPYKQIIIATGEGAKAALSAFDHLIRTPAAA